MTSHVHHRPTVAIATVLGNAVVRVVVVIKLHAVSEFRTLNRSIFGISWKTSRQIVQITRRLKAGAFQVAPVYGHYFELRSSSFIFEALIDDFFLLLFAHNVHHEEEHDNQ